MQVLSQFKASTYTGTGSAVSVECGFRPICVIIYNETDGDVMWIGLSGVAAGKCLQITNHADTQMSFLSSNGITLSDTGFTAGTSLSESAKVMRYVAF